LSARTVERQIPAVTKQITKRVVDRQATTREIPVPAQTQTLTRRVVKTPARVVENGTGASFNAGRISGFVDANSDGRDDRDGLSRTASASADRAGGGSRGIGAGNNANSGGAFGQKMGTISTRVVAEAANVVERRIPAVTKTISRRVVKTPARTQERVIPAKTTTVTRRVVDRPARRVVDRPASTQERVVPAVTKTRLSLRWKHVAVS